MEGSSSARSSGLLEKTLLEGEQPDLLGEPAFALVGVLDALRLDLGVLAQSAFSASSWSNFPSRDAPIVSPMTWWYGTPVKRWWLFVGMSSPAALSLRWSAMYARSCSSERAWRSFENANPMACCAARVMNKNLYPSSPSSAKEIGLGSLNHLNELDQLKASFASGNRRRTCSAKRSVGSRSEFGNSHQTRSGAPLSR